MSKQSRIIVDRYMKKLFLICSYFSVFVLFTMLVFVLIQGLVPFIRPTSESIQIVTENIPRIELNGQVYQGRRTAIPLEAGAELIAIQFDNRGETVSFQIPVLKNPSNPAQPLRFPPELLERLSHPEDYSFTLSYPGAISGLEQRIHINVPEPPYPVLFFILGQEWRPVYRKLYGILTMITATVLSTFGAVLLGVPIALLASVLISEFLSRRPASLVRSSIDLLAGIPSVVYGFFGLMIIVPGVQAAFGSSSGSSLMAAIIVLSIMILPTVVAISLTSLKAVPETYREASLALGATKMQTAWQIVFPSARSGIIASIILGTSRAVGETMAVILVAGNSPQIPRLLTDSVRTMTATIALEMGYSAGRHNQMLFSIGIVLFVIIFILNGIVMKLKQRMEVSA